MENASQKTLELLAQYDNHTSERDKAIEHIERRVVNEDMPTYDDLFKENVKLKLQLKEQETEIEALKSLVQGMRSSKLNANVVTVGDRSGESAQYVLLRKSFCYHQDLPTERKIRRTCQFPYQEWIVATPLEESYFPPQKAAVGIH